ncbi:DUF6701 domain-containing protein [Wenzhouxiangella sediminis]|uniref:DUF6701 domain-containing protein n=1 Tax=Wenzhouxiangella sediminis TaxID=1792836 RepID=A0A3E1KCL1_9GAMM|nr:DUF6701 domain-containing protein [Wenzhouxiangella sediminis]RFF32708.1 hypothetical protein DZC52_00880 [Wenzhouxiangella sediminis]
MRISAIPLFLLALGWSTLGQAQLISEWRMDESSWSGSYGEVVDSAGGNNGTARTAANDNSLPDTEPAQVCRGGRFRGQGFNLDEWPWYVNAEHYVRVPDDGSLSPLNSVESMSVGGWFRMSSSGGTLIHKGDGNASQEYRVHVSGNRLRMELWNRWGGDTSVTLSNQSLQIDTWYFFTATLERLGNSDNVRVQGYLFDESGQIGGVSQDVVSLDYTNKNTSGDLYFGAVSYGSSPVGFFDGTLDEFRLYADVRSSSDVAAHWGATRTCNGGGSGAIFSYFMEESQWTGASGEVTDSSGNALDATSVGGADTDDNEPAIAGSPGTCGYADMSNSGQRVVAPSSSLVNNADTFSLAGWVRMPDQWQTNSTPSIMAYGNTVGGQWPERYEVYMDRNYTWSWPYGFIDAWVFIIRKSNGNLQSLRVPVAPDASNNPLSGEWVHFVATYDSGTDDAQLYINGSFADDTGFSGPNALEDASGGLSLMAHPGGQYNAEGFIDEVYMFGNVLDAGEVSDLYQNTRPCDTGYDHIRLIHPATGLTCSESTITVQACADVDCTSLYPDPVEIDLTSPAANWIPDPVTFTGSTQVSLQYTPGGVVTLGAAAVDPAAANPTRCFTAGGVETNCEMEFFDSGFVIDIADHVADSLVNGTIAAVRSDPNNPEQCVPGFDNETKDLDFWSQYFNPGSGSLQVEIDGSLIATASPGTTIPIAFDGNGVGQFQLRYPDVGNVAMNAEYVGSGDEAGLVMTGQGQFVARPARFTLDIPDNPAATDETGDVFIAAGRDFEITVAARNASGGITPNFGQESTPEGVDLELDLFAPSGGVEPGLVGGFGNFATDCNGNSATAGTACGEFSWPEVGIVSLNPRLASGAYLGTADVVGTQVDHVGRFIPDHFELGSGDIIDRAGLSGCSSDFTYIGERFDTTFTLYARNAGGNTTGNYEGAFAFLGGGDLNLSATPTPDINGETVGWVMGVGDASAQLSLPRSSPEGPYPDYEVTTAPVDSDGVSLAGSGLIDSTELRFGRVVIDNAIGSELGPLELPWRTEYWDGSTWLVNGDDNCTALDLTADVSLASSGGDVGDGTTSVSLGGGTTSIDVAESDLTLASGIGSIHFTTPGSPGWVDVFLGLDPDWSFLRDDLDDDGDYGDDPQARASFGLFDGNSQRIYIREIAPQ